MIRHINVVRKHLLPDLHTVLLNVVTDKLNECSRIEHVLANSEDQGQEQSDQGLHRLLFSLHLLHALLQRKTKLFHSG